MFLLSFCYYYFPTTFTLDYYFVFIMALQLINVPFIWNTLFEFRLGGVFFYFNSADCSMTVSIEFYFFVSSQSYIIARYNERFLTCNRTRWLISLVLMIFKSGFVFLINAIFEKLNLITPWNVKWCWVVIIRLIFNFFGLLAWIKLSCHP